MGSKSSEIAIQSNYKMRQLYNDMQLLKMFNGMEEYKCVMLQGDHDLLNVKVKFVS